MQTLNIAHINIRGITSDKQYEIANFLHKYNVQVLAITETWLRPGKHFRLPHYQTFRKDRPCLPGQRTGGGALLLVQEDLEVENITLPPQFATQEAVHCRITTPTISIHTLAHYNKPHEQLNLAFYQHFHNQYANLIILGDLNAYSTALGDTQTNCNGVILDSIITQHTNLSALNLQDPQPTHIPGNQTHAPHILDYILVSPNILTKLNTFEVCPPDMRSDHTPIFANFQIIPNHPKPQPQPRSNYKRANWLLYKQTLDHACTTILNQHATIPPTSQGVDQLHNEIANAIQEASQQANTNSHTKIAKMVDMDARNGVPQES